MQAFQRHWGEWEARHHPDLLAEAQKLQAIGLLDYDLVPLEPYTNYMELVPHWCIDLNGGDLVKTQENLF